MEIPVHALKFTELAAGSVLGSHHAHVGVTELVEVHKSRGLSTSVLGVAPRCSVCTLLICSSLRTHCHTCDVGNESCTAQFRFAQVHMSYVTHTELVQRQLHTAFTLLRQQCD